MIAFEDFSFTYCGAAAAALQGLDLRIEPGEFVAVVGAAGAGKTSLCHALTGVVPHLCHGEVWGRVRIAGRDTAKLSVATLSTMAALVMQKPEHQLSGVRFTVREELGFALENRGLAPEKIHRLVESAMRETGLADLARCSPHRLSGGQLQRVVLAAALAADTPLLVLDEPTTFCDPASAARVFALLQRLCRKGRTVVLAEQRLDLVAEHAQRVLALHNGAVVLDGPPERVLVSARLSGIGLDRTRYTKVAELARTRGLWERGRPLPATLEAALDGLRRDDGAGDD